MPKTATKLKKAARPSNYIQTARAKKTPGKTVKTGGIQVMKKAGKKPIAFTKGGLHKSTGTPPGKPIPAAKKQAALSGKLGPKAKKQALFAKNVLTGKK